MNMLNKISIVLLLFLMSAAVPLAAQKKSDREQISVPSSALRLPISEASVWKKIQDFNNWALAPYPADGSCNYVDVDLSRKDAVKKSQSKKKNKKKKQKQDAEKASETETDDAEQPVEETGKDLKRYYLSPRDFQLYYCSIDDFERKEKVTFYQEDAEEATEVKREWFFEYTNLAKEMGIIAQKFRDCEDEAKADVMTEFTALQEQLRKHYEARESKKYKIGSKKMLQLQERNSERRAAQYRERQKKQPRK